ncbi:MAG: DUF4249 domain-containing protein [Bacteroidales bacterium]|nr:DUF4249 domain-containing protein [Bacteroidales bacterium]
MKCPFKIFFLFTGVVFVSSCVKVLDYDIPEDEKKIVVNGIISTYNPATIYVNKSLHVLDRLEIKPIDSAIVRIYENDILVTEIVEGTKGGYFSDFTGSFGNKYLLEVMVPGMKTASATCILPEPVLIEKVDTSSELQEFFEYGYYYQIYMLKSIIAITDPETIENFYELEGTLLYKEPVYYSDMDTFYITGYRKAISNSIIRSKDPVFEYTIMGDQVLSNQNENEFIIGNKLLFSDQLINGMKYNLNVSFSSFLFNANDVTTDSMRLVIRLKSVTKDYFTYMQLLERHLQARNDPFSERAQVNTNIENGLGILAGKSESVCTLEINQTPKPE